MQPNAPSFRNYPKTQMPDSWNSKIDAVPIHDPLFSMTKKYLKIMFCQKNRISFSSLFQLQNRSLYYTRPSYDEKLVPDTVHCTRTILVILYCPKKLIISPNFSTDIGPNFLMTRNTIN